MLLKDKKDQRDKERQGINYFVSQGWTPEQSSGIVSNLVHESNLNTEAVGDKNLKDKAYGIGQFRGSRFENLKKQYPGETWKNYENQLAFVNWELNNTERKAGDALRKVSHPIAASQVISDLYERPKKKFYEDVNRQQAAINVYKNNIDPNYNYEIKDTQQEIAQTGNMVRNTLTNLQTPQESSNLAEEETVEEPKEVEQAKQEISQKEVEQSFLVDYQAGKYNLQQSVQQPQQITEEQLPQQDLIGEFAQISQFVDSPSVLQQGGTYQDSLRLYNKFYISPKDYNSRGILNNKIIPFKNKQEQKEIAVNFGNSGNIMPIGHTNSDTFNPVYKKPNGTTRVNQTPLQNFLTPQGINTTSTELSPEIINEFIPNYIAPKYYDVHEAHGNSTTDYQVQNTSNINTDQNRQQTITPRYQKGGEINPRGLWDNPNAPVIIPSTQITTFPDPITGKPLNMNILGISNTGHVQIMKPNKNYNFKGESVYEIPLNQ